MNFKSILLSSFATASLFASTADHSSHINWGYHGEMAPENWGKLSKICTAGKHQSPINIVTKDVVKAKDHRLKFFDYDKLADFNVLNNGHTIKAVPHFHESYNNAYITVDGIEYALIQFHLHTHSESTINGEQSDMVLHFVHQSYDGDLAVVAVFYKIGKENPEVDKFWTSTHLDKLDTHVLLKDVEFSHILPKNLKSYYHFQGSLTTPPCSEEVEWFVMKEKLELSQKQIDSLRAIFPDNYRPVQDLNGRIVEEF
ncbi:carbonic anhydrase [Thiovulum sp. ES]|nr:carbonic anhydrase [Thiovulum sp. ES]